MVLVNGSPTNEFEMGKGVRQEDPLSPFLFIMAMEGLNAAMNSTCEKSIFSGIMIPKEDILLSYLFYADDALFMGDWSIDNI